MGSSNVKVGDIIHEYTVKEILNSRYIIGKCSCGKEKKVNKYHLLNGRIKSCGHLRTQALSDNANNKFIDLKDKVFYDWTVLEYAGNSNWKCRCSCGDEHIISGYALRKGKTKSCGHDENKFQDLTNERFNEWKVLEYVGNKMWRCRCSCGTVKNVSSGHLKSGRSKSCGHDGHKFIDLTDSFKGDLHIDEYVGNMLWKCTCTKCGEVKIIASSSLRNDNYSYECKNMHHIGEVINNLEIIGQLSGISVIAKCKLCNSVKIYQYSNLIKAKTCGCNRPKQYSKDECLSAIHEYTRAHGEKPFIEDLTELLNIHKGTAYNYRNRYELDTYLNNTYGSRYERDVANFLDKLNVKYSIHNRVMINPYELDFYMHEQRLAIEINGDYWHSSNYLDKYYHKNKTLACNKVGVSVIHLFEHELRCETKKKIIFDTLRSIIKPIKVYARELKIIEVDTETTKEFINGNHINGYAVSSINLALVDNNGEIFGMMTFGVPRFDYKSQYELIRLCFKSDNTVVGGAQKLFKYFISKYHPTSIISYCDISKFSGKIYDKLGFHKVGETEPGYVWVKYTTNDVLSRYQTQKHKLVEKGLGTDEQTEDEIMSSLGYLKIYNCGNYKFEWNSTIDTK